MPSDLFFKVMNRVHRGLLKVSGGRIGWTLRNMPVLELTTIGRRSGNSRSVMLTSPHQENDRFVIVASKGGESTNPDWFLNLRKTPHVIVTMKGGRTCNMISRVASTKDRERLWPMVISKYGNYASYQETTDREIPLVIIEPAD
jgi:deazaflavin-dependent oxidoreductase (nitroreductase family)